MEEEKETEQTSFNYAKQFLEKKGIKLINARNGEQLLRLSKEHLWYKGEPTLPTIFEKQDLLYAFFGTDMSSTREIDYHDLKNYGFVIVSYPIKKSKMFKGQKLTFSIVRKDKIVRKPNLTIYDSTPPELFIRLHIAERALRLEGIGTGYSGHTRWFKIQEDM